MCFVGGGGSADFVGGGGGALVGQTGNGQSNWGYPLTAGYAYGGTQTGKSY